MAGLIAAGVLTAAAGYYVWSAKTGGPVVIPPLPGSSAPRVAFSDFVGAETCGECHASAFAAWRGSTHAHAGGAPSRDRVIAPFNGAPLHFRDATVTPSITAGEYRFTVVQPGRARRVFRVDQVVGGGFMEGGGTQAFFSRFPDGTLRMLPFDYSKSAGKWFCNTRSRVNEGAVFITPAVSLADCTDWTPNRILGSVDRFQGCQQCHGSQINVAFSDTLHRYETRFTTLAVNCESCHGAGRRHVELARSGQIGSSADIGMESLETATKEASIGVCFQCHAVKSQIQPGYLPGDRQERFFALKLPQLLDTVYHPDGRTRTFAYQEGHLASDCYLNGSMTCVDCHDPHSQRYRDVNGTTLSGRFDNRQCTSCHPSKAEPVERHTHHAASSAGSRCVACHMPYLQQPEVGDHVRYGRSDHTIPVPRPAYDTRLGVETACVQCHGDIPADQLANRTTNWWGEIKPHRPAIRAILAADSLSDPAAAATRLLATPQHDPLVSTIGAARVLDRYRLPGAPAVAGEVKRDIREMARSEDLDLKALGLAMLHLLDGSAGSTRRFLGAQAAGLDSAIALPVRLRWAWVLKARGDVQLRAGDLRAAVAAYARAAEVQPDDPDVHRSLGVVQNRLGDYEQAERELRKSLELNPSNPQVYVDLGTTLLQRGDVPGAVESFRKAIVLSPSDPVGYANLGLAMARRGTPQEAIEPLRAALALDASLADAHFVLGSVYATLGRLSDAAQEVRQGLEFDPGNQPARQLLDEIVRQSGDSDQAVQIQ